MDFDFLFVSSLLVEVFAKEIVYRTLYYVHRKQLEGFEMNSWLILITIS